MTIKNAKLTGEPKSWVTTLQGFIDDVTSVLRAPGESKIVHAIVKDFEWIPSVGTHVDVQIGLDKKPRAILFMNFQEKDTESLYLGAGGITWTWRNGYARIELGKAGLGASARWKITIMVIP